MLGQKRRPCVVREGAYDICELFSPARVTKFAKEEGLKGGWSLDIKHVDEVTGKTSDLSDPKVQNQVSKMLGRDKPLVVSLSPPCTLFSLLQNLRKTEIDPKDFAKALECVRFSVKVARYQIRNGRFYYFEHPLTATSRNLDDLQELAGEIEIEAAIVHMCRFGITSSDSEGAGLVKKPTNVLTNMASIAESIGLRCEGGIDMYNWLAAERRRPRSMHPSFAGLY